MKNEALIVGNTWTAPLIAEAFRSKGRPVTTLSLCVRPAPEVIPISIGNGERSDKAIRIFGEEVATLLWEISRRNYSRARRLLASYGVEAQERGAWWFPHSPGEDPIREPGLHFSRPALERGLARQGLTGDRIERVTGLDRLGAFDYRLRYLRGGEPWQARAPLVLIASEDFPPALLPSFADKWLQVTLGSFLFEIKRKTDFSIALFHDGADFAMACGEKVRLGSFRNLYLDKAVGVRDSADPATLSGVRRFFGSLGWIEQTAPCETHLDVETLCCDGLPLVGTVPDHPGVYLITGFAGRAQNFLFELAHLIVQGLLDGTALGELALFSTKRFT